MALTNAERQQRYRGRRKIAAARNEVVTRFEAAIDEAIVALWTIMSRMPDRILGAIPLDQFRFRWSQLPGQELAHACLLYGELGSEAECVALRRAAWLIDQVLSSERR